MVTAKSNFHRSFPQFWFYFDKFTITTFILLGYVQYNKSYLFFP